MQNEKVTLKKLAGMLDLDVSSVSLALRDSPKISLQTKQRVRSLADRFNYSPNIAARQLRSSIPKLVGLVLPAAMDSLANPTAGKTIQFLAEQCAARGIIFQILSAANLEEEAVLSLLPETLFVWGDIPRRIFESGPLCRRHVIVLDPNHISYEKFAGRFVGVDNFSGGKAVAKHFLERKASRLLLVQVCSDHLGHKLRLEGAFREWLRHRPASSLGRCVLPELTDRDLIRFSRQGNGAIFCSNDWGALQVWHRFSRLGVRMPADVCLAGFDGEEAALLAGITTMIFDWHKVAQTALQMMYQLIQRSSGARRLPVSITIPVILHKGRTT